MKNAPTPSLNAESILKLIWFGMILSCSFFAIIPYFIIQGQSGITESDSMINNFLISAGCASLFMSFFIPNFLISKIKNTQKLDQLSLKDLFPALIVKYALIESVSLIGLILSVVNQNQQLVIPFVLSSIGLYLFAYPSKEKLKNYLKN